MKSEKSVIVAIFVVSVITAASVAFSEPGHSFGGGYGYGMENSQSPSSSSSSGDSGSQFGGGNRYVRAECLPQWKDWAGSCCKQYKSNEECEKKTHKSCTSVDPTELEARYKAARKRSSAEPACSGDY